MHTHGEGSWPDVPRKAGLRRCSKSCRLRWRNYLHPGVKRGNFSASEEEIIWKLQALVGNRWSLIARRLPGRTDNEIKNFWNTRMKKKLRSMGIDPGTRRMNGSAKSSIPLEPTGLTIPRATVPIVRPLEDPSASSRTRPIGYSVQISSEDRGNAPSGGSDLSAGVQGDVQPVARDPTEEEMIRCACDVPQAEHSSEQLSYYNSLRSISSPSCYSSELQQIYAQKVDSPTNATAEFMGCSGILLPDSDWSEMKSMQEFCDEPFSPWAGLTSSRFINDCLQSMDASGDGGDLFGGFNQFLLW